MRPRGKSWLLAVSLLWLCGCGYHLVSPTSGRSVYLARIENRTRQPQLEFFLTEGFKRRLLECPGLRLAGSAASADTLVTLRLTDCHREPLFFSLQETQDILIGSLRVSLEVEITEAGQTRKHHLVQENLPFFLSKSYREEEILAEISRRLATRVIFLLLKGKT
ncbi:MAG TPA: hypothetical protein PKX93_04030 [bacterium]|nr:hypothetical protein [bacterium]HPP11350.1 hypothetical protein [bacterium]